MWDVTLTWTPVSAGHCWHDGMVSYVGCFFEIVFYSVSISTRLAEVPPACGCDEQMTNGCQPK